MFSVCYNVVDNLYFFLDKTTTLWHIYTYLACFECIKKWYFLCSF